MQRTILFRGKRVDNGDWVEGWLMGDHIHTQVSWAEPDGQYEWWGVEVYPESIGQFTGFTDKNGVRIFEGDIVKHKFRRIWKTEEHISTVIWKQELCCYYLFDGISNHRMRDDMIYEIIGNKFDNPELLNS